MNHGIFTIKDETLNTYEGVFSAPTNLAAIRQFEDLCKTPNTALFKHPSDFSLVRIGNFLPTLGTIEPEDIQQIAKATDFHDEPQSET